MSNFFSVIASGFKWIGKELVKAATWVPKIVTLVKDVEGDASTILPEIATVIDGAGDFVAAIVKDSGADLAATETLVAAIVTAAKADVLSIADDEAVVVAFQTFISTVTKTSNYSDILAAASKLVKDYDTLGSSVKAALAQLESAASE
jgi:hypothetical protein